MRSARDAPSVPRLFTLRDLVLLDCGAAGVFVMLTFSGAFGTPAGNWRSTAIAMLVTALPTVVRRVWPVPVFAVALVGAAAVLLVYPTPGPLLCVGWALYPVALRTRRRRWEPTILVAAVSFVVLLGGAMSGSTAENVPPTSLALIGLLALGCSWTLGRLVAERRSIAVRVARQEAARAAEAAVSEERLRIARELHDVVSHTLSVIGVKAAVAAHVADTRPEEILDALAVIQTSSREAIGEMRRMLGALRAEPSTGELLPQPGLQSLERLALQAGEAGVIVKLAVDGLDVVPPGLWPSVYRLVQESLTNAVRHAAPTRCRVTVKADVDEVRVDVVDDGPPPGGPVGPGSGAETAPAAGPIVGPVSRPRGGMGLGLLGMQERVAVHGGHFEAGPRPEGGFAVTVRIPCSPWVP